MITCSPLRLAGELNVCIQAYSSQHIGDYLQTTASATSVETYAPWKLSDSQTHTVTQVHAEKNRACYVRTHEFVLL